MDHIQRALGAIKRQMENLPFSFQGSLNYVNKSVNKVRFPPINRESTLYYYLPLQGILSYTTLSVSVMNPHVMLRLFPKRDVTDLLFISAGTGAGLWLWGRPHMAAAAPSRRFSWALVGGCIWPLGSIFMWAIIRSSIGRRPILGTVLGITTGAMLTNIVIDYFRYVELMFCGEIHLPEEPYSPNSDDEKFDIDL